MDSEDASLDPNRNEVYVKITPPASWRKALAEVECGASATHSTNLLRKNGNPYPVCEEHATEFRVTYPTRTVESVAKLGLEPYHFGLEKTDKTEVAVPGVASTLKSTQKTTDSTLKELVEKNPSVTIESLATSLGITRDGVNKAIRRLKITGVIRRVGPDKGGHWEIVEQV